jgi:hypothetical protein
MTSNYIKSDSVEVKSLKMTSVETGQEFDISNQVASFDIYEDIIFPVIRAEFVILDTVDLLNLFPIKGEELITVEFANPGVDLVNSYKFHVKNIENQIVTNQAKAKSYVIKAVSEEMITSSYRFVAKKYKGETSSIIQTIFKEELKSDKNLLLGDETKGVQDLLVSRLRPLQAIDMFRKRAVSKFFESSSYVFFENKRGFNFCTIEYLMANLSKNVNDKVFFYDTTGNSDSRNMNTRGILTLVNVSQVNNTKKLTSGSLNNVVKKFDLLTGKVTKTEYKDSEQQQKFKYTSDNSQPINSSKFQQQYGKDPAVTMLVPTSSDLPENYISDSLGKKHSFVTKVSQNIYQALIYGDVALTAGDVVDIRIPSFSGETGNTNENKLLAGKYLISKLRHIVMNFSSRDKQYYCSMELIKGTYGD